MARAPWSRAKTAGKDREYLVARGDGRLAGLIDQMGRHHAVRRRHMLREERRKVGVGRAVFEYPGHEAIAERLGEGGKTLRLAESVSLEPIGQHREIVALEPRLD